MRGYFSIKFFSLFVVFLFGCLFFVGTVLAKDVVPNGCCLYYTGSGFSPDCLSIADDSPADCSAAGGIYPDNLEGGYISRSETTESCIDVPGRYVSIVESETRDICIKALALSGPAFLKDLNSAQSSGVLSQLNTWREKWCCFNSEGSCQEYPIHAPSVRANLLGEIERGTFKTSVLSSESTDIGELVTCSLSSGGTDSDWNRYEGSCAEFAEKEITPCVGDGKPTIESDKILKAEAASTLNPMKFKLGVAGVNDFVGRAIAALTFTMGSLLLLFYVYAGVLWMTSAGSSERVGKAKQIAIWSTLGVIVVLASYAIVTILFKFAG